MPERGDGSAIDVPAKPGRGARFVETTRKRAVPPHDAAPAEPSVVLAHHPQLARTGEWFPLRSRLTAVARLEPVLHAIDCREVGPLDDPYLSRQPIELTRIGGDAIEIANPHGVELAIGGAPLAAGAVRRVTAAELATGVDLVLGGRVVLWLSTDHDLGGGDDLGLFGRSTAMRALRDDIRAAAAGRGPVAVLGETGTGKELVAKAIHASGPRASGPFVVVNVAAIPAAVAAAELFGHEKGAFTGAGERRTGYVERAAGGVLFLDEIGELPEAIQPLLLRVLETGEIQPVGGAPRTVDVLVVAATDAELEARVAAGSFRGPLYYRLAASPIHVPPLRARGVDAALLLARFLLETLPPPLTDSSERTPWLPATLVADLARAPWPGNVRQVRAAALRLAALARANKIATAADLGPSFALDDDDALETTPPATPITDDHLVATLRAHRFQLNRTAEALSISRTHLDALISRSPTLRKAKDLTRPEIEAALALSPDLDTLAARLEVSPRGLKLRMRALGL